jgi:hypothetical protein
MRKKKQKWDIGDVFVVPLEDGTYSSGQVISCEDSAMGSVVCAFSSDKSETVRSAVDTNFGGILIAVLFVTRDLLDSGKWQVVDNRPIVSFEQYLNLSELRKKGFVGVKIVGSFNVTTLLNAFHKLIPWNNFHNPNYLDSLLVSSDRKPADILLK